MPLLSWIMIRSLDVDVSTNKKSMSFCVVITILIWTNFLNPSDSEAFFSRDFGLKIKVIPLLLKDRQLLLSMEWARRKKPFHFTIDGWMGCCNFHDLFIYKISVWMCVVVNVFFLPFFRYLYRDDHHHHLIESDGYVNNTIYTFNNLFFFKFFKFSFHST